MAVGTDRTVVVTNELIWRARTPRGAWTRAQLAVLGIEWPPRSGWMKTVLGKEISVEAANDFVRHRTTSAKDARQAQAVVMDSDFEATVAKLAEVEWAQMEESDPQWLCVFETLHDVLARAIRAEMRLEAATKATAVLPPQGKQVCKACGRNKPGRRSDYCRPCRKMR